MLAKKWLENARSIMDKIEETQLENRGLYFRVMVGPFRTRAEAVKAQSALAKDSRFAGSYIRYLP